MNWLVHSVSMVAAIVTFGCGDNTRHETESTALTINGAAPRHLTDSRDLHIPNSARTEAFRHSQSVEDSPRLMMERFPFSGKEARIALGSAYSSTSRVRTPT
jgi:hypothetical protein